MKKILLIIFLVLLAGFAISSYPVMSDYMLRKNIWPYERKMTGMSLFKGGGYGDKYYWTYYRVEKRFYNYTYKDSFLVDDTSIVEGFRGYETYVNEYGDTVLKRNLKTVKQNKK